MARMLAIEWDQQQARYVVASTRGTHLEIDAAGAIDLPASAEGMNSRLQVGPAIQAALAEQKIGRATTLVGIDRSQIELLSLTLPPCSDAELPQLGRNQAMRESNAIVDDTTLDFVVLSDDPQEPRKVMAVGLSRDRLARILATCSEAGLTPQAIVLRPYAAAALFRSTVVERPPVCLLINVFAEEIDLAIVQSERVVFWRTLRQSNASTDPTAAKKLIGEINRTMVVASSHLTGQTIDAVYLFGGHDEHPALIEPLRAELGVPLTTLDPFAAADSADFAAPENAGRFSSLLGMLAVEAQGGAQAVDFLHPRQTPAPPDRRRTMILAASAAGLLLLLGTYHVWSTLSSLDAENATLSEELDRLDDRFKQAGKQQKAIQAIRDWGENDVNWLDELRDLSLRFPSGRDAVLLRMALSHSRTSGGNIDMSGVVRDPVIVSRIENNLRDKYHQISSRHVQEHVQEKSYAWHFEAQLVITPRDKKQYTSHLPSRPDTQDDGPAEAKKAAPKPKVKPLIDQAAKRTVAE